MSNIIASGVLVPCFAMSSITTVLLDKHGPDCRRRGFHSLGQFRVDKQNKKMYICKLQPSNMWREVRIRNSFDIPQARVYPKKYAQGFCFAVLCWGYTLTDFPISIRLTSLALWQSNDCPSASKATLMNMDKYFMWIHYERLHNHNKAKHNKTVCIFLGIYCILSHDLERLPTLRPSIIVSKFLNYCQCNIVHLRITNGVEAIMLCCGQVYSMSQEICTRFCCALLCCGYAIVHNEFTWSIYPYSSGLLCWHWGNR